MDCDNGVIERIVVQVAQRLVDKGLMLACAESCTGGWVAKACTDQPGSSRWFERGFVTYTNESKQEMLGVGGSTLEAHGAVSLQTVAEMASGALRHSRAQVSLAISGIAGPGGATPGKPVGTVCFAWRKSGEPVRIEQRVFAGGRQAVRCQAVVHALQGVLDVLAD